MGAASLGGTVPFSIAPPNGTDTSPTTLGWHVLDALPPLVSVCGAPPHRAALNKHDANQRILAVFISVRPLSLNGRR
jgi:hypothetical protein